jgi:hypothetical protein
MHLRDSPGEWAPAPFEVPQIAEPLPTIDVPLGFKLLQDTGIGRYPPAKRWRHYVATSLVDIDRTAVGVLANPFRAYLFAVSPAAG